MKKSLIAVSIAALLLGACSQKEKTLTVPEYLADQPLMNKTRHWCLENPAEREPLANCINASSALLKVINGSYAREQAAQGKK